jgi:hypothetical protein
MSVSETLIGVLQQLEGPYKGYVITAAIVFITALITRFVFKTFKWFMVLMIVGAMGIGALWLLAQLTNL